MKFIYSIAFLIFVSILIFCGKNPSSQEEVEKKLNIKLSHDEIELHICDETQIEATVFDEDSNIVNNIAIQWTSNDTTIAIVDSLGVVQGNSRGETFICATIDEDIYSYVLVRIIFPEKDALMGKWVATFLPSPRIVGGSVYSLTVHSHVSEIKTFSITFFKEDSFKINGSGRCFYPEGSCGCSWNGLSEYKMACSPMSDIFEIDIDYYFYGLLKFTNEELNEFKLQHQLWSRPDSLENERAIILMKSE